MRILRNLRSVGFGSWFLLLETLELDPEYAGYLSNGRRGLYKFKYAFDSHHDVVSRPF